LGQIIEILSRNCVKCNVIGKIFVKLKRKITNLIENCQSLKVVIEVIKIQIIGPK